MIVRAGRDHLDGWARLRARLWPEDAVVEHLQAIEAQLADGHDLVAFVAVADDGVIGFAEASIRRDHVNGCDTSPVAFLEGIAVDQPGRRRGVARALVAAVEEWGRTHGCTELGSDADEENLDGRHLHLRLGFEERERVVFYRKRL